MLALHEQAADELGATCSAGRAKKAWGRRWEGVAAMGVMATGVDLLKVQRVADGQLRMCEIG